MEDLKGKKKREKKERCRKMSEINNNTVTNKTKRIFVYLLLKKEIFGFCAVLCVWCVFLIL